MKPQVKRRKYLHCEVKPLPTDCKISGIFNGLDVEIFETESMKILNECGSYGSNSRPRQAVSVSFIEKQAYEKISQAQYKRRLEWKEKFGNSGNPQRLILVEGQDEPVEDPFTIEKSHLLFPEEAMFLQKELKCLEIKDLDEKLVSTEDLWNKFCKLKHNFVECYVAYIYLKSKNWVVKTGLKFGGNFLLYKQSPQYYHATFVVKVITQSEIRTCYENLTNERIAEVTKKAMLYIEIYHPVDVDAENHLTNLDKFKVKEVVVRRYHVKQISRN